MSTVEKVALGIVGVAFVTTLLLPDRQTPKVINEFRKLFVDSLRTSMGR